MKNVGIFGDSFGDPGENQFSKFHWINLIHQKLGITVTNYCESGSSQYFSYKKFLENHEKHDDIIFVATDPHRYVVPIKDNSGIDSHFPNILHLENSNKISDTFKKQLIGWFLSSSESFNIDMSDLTMEEIYRIRPSTLFIPSFDTSFSDRLTEKFNIPKNVNLFDVQKFQLVSIFRKELKIFHQLKENNMILSGHLLPELNEIVFNNIKHRIENEKWNWNIPENITVNFKFEEVYFKR
jgi:hypothetical protein